MPSLRSFFRGLRWKLTLSYTLVTVAALVVVLMLAGAAVLIFIQNERFLPRLGAQTVAGSAGQIAPALDRRPPDLDRVERWLDLVETNGFQTSFEYGGEATFDPHILTGNEMQILVVDREAQVVARRPERSGPVGSPVDTSAAPQLAELLDNALAGERDLDRLYTVTPEKILLIAVPVLNSDSRTVGAVVYYGPLSVSEAPLPEVLQTFFSFILLITLTAGLIGTIFGFFTARGLTRRLGKMSRAAEAWSRGDFSVQARDRSTDELGQLARNLNHMAGQLGTLIETRQDLATMEERNRLARDLHDSVKQQAFAISMNLGAAQALWERDPDKARSKLDAAAALSRQAQNELTALISTLRPVQLEGRGLASALRDYLPAWQRNTGIQAVFEARGSGQMPPEYEQALFRIAQEGLANIARHSGAKEARLTLEFKNGQVRLEVSDDGRGFNAMQPAKGLGLQSMRERAQALGGELRLQSGSQGTRLSAVLPLKHAAGSNHSAG